MRNVAVGILASVDAGKTTLSEAILYLTGTIRKYGRVDHKDAFLDTHQFEKDRGITVYAKEAHFVVSENAYTLIDTPGHADFASETERAITVLDYAILLVDGADEIKDHTRLLWELLEAYKIPTIIFVNKMDLDRYDKAEILAKITDKNDGLGKNADSIIEFDMQFFQSDNEQETPNPNMEKIAIQTEALMNEFLEKNTLQKKSIIEAVNQREIVPLMFGSALKLDGVSELLTVLNELANFPQQEKPEKDPQNEPFGAKVYKISRDKKGNRQTHIKITSGVLKNKMQIDGEKVAEIRLYSGANMTQVTEAKKGDVCVLTGLQNTYVGEGLGELKESETVPKLKAPLMYRVLLKEGVSENGVILKLKELAEENPTLELAWREDYGEIQIHTMGMLELEIFKNEAKSRYGIEIDYGEAHENIEDTDKYKEMMAQLAEEERKLLEEERLLAERNLVMPEDAIKLGKGEEKELDAIFKKTYGVSKRDETLLKENKSLATRRKSSEITDFPALNWSSKDDRGREHFIIDGYNVIFSWEELAGLASANFDSAREMFIEILSNYQGYKNVEITVVFDGYKVAGNIGTKGKQANVNVIYTKEAETADRYIETFVYENAKKENLTVVTSDKPVQMAGFGDGAKRMSSREFKEELIATSQEIRQKLERQVRQKNTPFADKF